jgi:psiF repeat
LSIAALMRRVLQSAAAAAPRLFQETHMKTIVTAFALAFALATPAFATTHKEAPGMKGCTAQADDKKLAGAARTSFVKKCEKDAMAANPAAAACEKSAADKKLAGAAKTSHMKKCVADGGPMAAAKPASAAK